MKLHFKFNINNKKLNSIMCVLLSFVMVACFFTYSFADLIRENIVEENTYENTTEIKKTINIDSVDDFIKFTDKCSLDTYSKNLYVNLNTDINLNDKKFNSIPIFYGIFDGKNHSIKGLTLNNKGSLIGLFRKIEKGACIKNLNVEGKLTPAGSMNKVGILAGENDGLIKNCIVKGSVTADQKAGGIVGENLTGGYIENSTSFVSVIANKNVGGIAGFNNGIIHKCKNNGKVVTTEKKISKEEKINLVDIPDLLKDEHDEFQDEVMNIGGIAGNNEGIIKNCNNNSTVGYKHRGYNIGGIVGIQNAIVKNCNNKGHVYGRKDIGGIVGQFEPDLTFKYKDKSSEIVEEQLDDLSDLMKKLNHQSADLNKNMTNKATEINYSLRVLKDVGNDVAVDTEDQTVNTVNKIYDYSQNLNKYSSNIIDAYKLFSDDIEIEVDNLNEEIEKIIDEIDEIDIDENGKISELKNKLKPHIENLKEKDVILNEEIEKISTKIRALNTFVDEVSDTLDDENLNVIDKIIKIRASLNTFLESDFTQISKSLVKINETITYINSENIEIYNILKDYSENRVDDIDDEIENIKDEIDSINDNVDKAIDNIENIKEIVDNFNEVFNNNIDNINTEIDNISDATKYYSDFLDEKWDKEYDKIIKEMYSMSDSISSLEDISGDKLLDMNNTVDKVIDKISDVVESVTDLIEPPVYEKEDISNEIDSSQNLGQIRDCKNTGKIYGDSDVGGISGIIGFEIIGKPDIDFEEDVKILRDTKAFLRAQILNCNNDGNINSENGYVGGIVGKSVFGTVYNCINQGTIKAEGSSKCGGIAGYSNGDIKKSYALCEVIGIDEVGGIAGNAKNIENCASIVTVKANGEKIGEVAGIVDEDDAKIYNNVFVKKKYAAVDGISYKNKAYPLEYNKFINYSGVPDIFEKLFVEFYIDGKLVKNINVGYGSDINIDEIPKIPFNEQKYGQWKNLQKNNITKNKKIYAQYNNWITTIASGGKVPKMLVEDKYSPKAKLSIKEVNLKDLGDIKLPSKWNNVHCYKYSVEDSLKKPSERMLVRVRVNNPDKTQLAVIENNRLKNQKFEIDGSYLKFEGKSSQYILIYEPNYINKKIVAVIFVIIAILTVLIFKIKNKKQLKKIKNKKIKNKK